MNEAMSKCDGNYDIVQDMIGCFFDEADPLIAKMRSALSDSNAAGPANAAHRLKGTVLYLGAHSAADATQRVEQIGKSGDLVEAAEAIGELANEIERLYAALAPHRRDWGNCTAAGLIPHDECRR
jgi:HPt (histidine-containing phosphotransfer) domain-containing protein